jgi:hypothetical protein
MSNNFELLYLQKLLSVAKLNLDYEWDLSCYYEDLGIIDAFDSPDYDNAVRIVKSLNSELKILKKKLIIQEIDKTCIFPNVLTSIIALYM